MTHTIFQELLLTPFNVHEILGFEILSSEKHSCHWEIFEILLRVWGLDPCVTKPSFTPVLSHDSSWSWCIIFYPHPQNLCILGVLNSGSRSLGVPPPSQKKLVVALELARHHITYVAASHHDYLHPCFTLPTSLLHITYIPASHYLQRCFTLPTSLLDVTYIAALCYLHPCITLPTSESLLHISLPLPLQRDPGTTTFIVAQARAGNPPSSSTLSHATEYIPTDFFKSRLGLWAWHFKVKTQTHGGSQGSRAFLGGSVSGGGRMKERRKRKKKEGKKRNLIIIASNQL